MIRNLKALGLALVAIFAMGAVVASAASAQQGTLTSTGPVTLVGDEIAGQTNALTYPGLVPRVECPGSTATGHKTLTEAQTVGLKHEPIPVPATAATLTPHYSNCHAINAAGGETHKSTVTMNGCDYDLRIGETTGGADTYGVFADLVCPPGKVVEVHIYPFAGSELGGSVCTLTIPGAPSNQNLSGPHLTSVTGVATHDLTLIGTFEKVKAIKHNSGGCPEGAAETTEAKLDVAYTITGKNAAGLATPITITHP